jgi:NAD(P)-dependent dehydrogenase (short-subunit alcohol dehydrogenase family)
MIGTQMILLCRIAAIPHGRMCQTWEVAVANVIAFRASDAAGSVACTCIRVDRGWPDGL